MRSLRTTVIAAIAVLATQATAQTRDPFAQRDARVPPAVAALQAKGVKLTFLGDEGGLRAYLGESANGRMQTFYIAPDGSHFVAGILFTPDGSNVTGVQIGEMRARFDAAARSLGAASPIEGDDDAQPAEVPAELPERWEESVPDGDPGEAAADDRSLEPAGLDPAPAAVDGASLSLPPADGPVLGAAGNPSELWISKLDRDEFAAAAQDTPFFEVGSKSAPVTLWMVADPRCPYCHAAWNHLRPAIADRKINVRVIMIAALDGSREIARDMLSRPIPGNAFIRADAGQRPLPDAGQVPVDPETDAWLDTNMAFAQRFGIDRTPFLGYTSEDGQFYSALGLPSDLESFFHAAGL